MVNRHFILFALAFAAALSGVAKTFDVDISTGRPAASNEAYYHGETIEFRAVRGRSVVTNIEYGCIYYQTNGMGDAWWKTDGLTFHPSNDVGAASYRFFLEGRDDVGRDWHANGLLRMLDSPGFEPSAVQLPAKTIDFATVEVTNAPWADAEHVGVIVSPDGTEIISCDYFDGERMLASTAPEGDEDARWYYARTGFLGSSRSLDRYDGGERWEYRPSLSSVFTNAAPTEAFPQVLHLVREYELDGETEVYEVTLTRINEVYAITNTFRAAYMDDVVNATNAISSRLAGVATSGDYNDLANKPIYNNTGVVLRECSHEVSITNVVLASGEVFAGLAIIGTNLVGIVPVVGTTACVRVWAPYAEGHYSPNQFSAVEIGNQNQALFSQRIIAGTAIYCPSPSMLRFTSGLDPEDPQSSCRTLQDYLDVLSPDAVSSIMAGFLPASGDGVIDGSLTVNGAMVVNGAIALTNANMTMNGFLSVGGCLQTDGMAVSNGTCHIRRANTPRIHIDNGGGDDPWGFALTNVTFGGTADAPYGNLRDYIHGYVRSALLNDRSDIVTMIRDIVEEALQEPEQTRGVAYMDFDQEEPGEEEREESEEEEPVRDEPEETEVEAEVGEPEDMR